MAVNSADSGSRCGTVRSAGTTYSKRAVSPGRSVGFTVPPRPRGERFSLAARGGYGGCGLVYSIMGLVAECGEDGGQAGVVLGSGADGGVDGPGRGAAAQ